jgi:hypothetical protein
MASAAQQTLGLKIIPLTDTWARRRFVFRVRDDAVLSVPARLLVDSLCDSVRATKAEPASPRARARARKVRSSR